MHYKKTVKFIDTGAMVVYHSLMIKTLARLFTMRTMREPFYF